MDRNRIGNEFNEILSEDRKRDAPSFFPRDFLFIFHAADFVNFHHSRYFRTRLLGRDYVCMYTTSKVDGRMEGVNT